MTNVLEYVRVIFELQKWEGEKKKQLLEKEPKEKPVNFAMNLASMQKYKLLKCSKSFLQFIKVLINP